MNEPAVRGFDWDRGNRDKCLKHGMSVEDIEAVFSRSVVILADKENLAGERRLKAIGTTPAGDMRSLWLRGARREGQRIAAANQRAVHAQEGS